MEGGDVYGPGFLTARIPLLPSGVRREATFYHEHGDWFGWGCVVLAVVGLASSGRRLRQAGRD
jgi:apolipoprotein N-acyltransferase